MRLLATDYVTVYRTQRLEIDFLFTKRDRQTVVDLTGYGAGVSFWYGQLAPHIVRGAAVVGSSGLVRYVCQGDEFTTNDDIYFQAVAKTVDLPAGTDRAWASIAHPVVRWRVIETP